MSTETLATAAMISLGLLPLGNLALIRLAQRGLVDIPVIFGHLSGYPAGALVAVLSCATGLAPWLAWLLTAATYSASLGAGLGLRRSLDAMRQE